MIPLTAAVVTLSAIEVARAVRWGIASRRSGGHQSPDSVDHALLIDAFAQRAIEAVKAARRADF